MLKTPRDEKTGYKAFFLFFTVWAFKIKNTLLSWPVWLSWLEHRTVVNWKGAGSILGQGTCLVCKLSPRSGACTRGNQSMFHSHINVPLSLSVPSPLSKINTHVLMRLKKKKNVLRNTFLSTIKYFLNILKRNNRFYSDYLEVMFGKFVLCALYVFQAFYNMYQ